MQSKFQRGQWVIYKEDSERIPMWIEGQGVKFNAPFETSNVDLKNYQCRWKINGREDFTNYNEEDLELVDPQPRNKFEQDKPEDDLKIE